MFFYLQLNGVNYITLLALMALLCSSANIIIQLRVVIVPPEVEYNLVWADVP